MNVPKCKVTSLDKAAMLQMKVGSGTVEILIKVTFVVLVKVANISPNDAPGDKFACFLPRLEKKTSTSRNDDSDVKMCRKDYVVYKKVDFN